MNEATTESVHRDQDVASKPRANERRSVLVVLISATLVVALPITTTAADWVALGHRDDGSVITSREPCDGRLTLNHDSTFENAYGWRSDGAWPEYYGAWGEAYDLGACQVVCGAYWLSTLPELIPGQPANIYIWEGGVSGPPGAVLFMRPDVHFDDIPNWPEVGQYDAAIGAVVSGEFTIGFWGNWGPNSEDPGFWVGADEDGPGGRPWTYIAPDLGAPSGWQNPNVVFDDCRSLGIGLYYDDIPVPAEASSWGVIKTLFQDVTK